jgi:hypothetical protein
VRKRRHWLRLGALLTLLLLAGASPAAARVGPRRGLGNYFFGPRLARAEVVLVDAAQTHDFRIDRGRLRSNPRSGNLELKELDGSIQVVPVSPSAQVFVNGQAAGLAQLVPGMTVTTIRDGSAPAQQVLAQRVRGFGEYFFGPGLARAEVVVVDGGQTHDFRIDRGRLRTDPRSGNLELKELDGSIQVVPVSPSAHVFLNRHAASLAQLARGMILTTIRDGSAPAQQVFAQGSPHFRR